MKAFVITLPEKWESASHKGAEVCIHSIKTTQSKLSPELFYATTPSTLSEDIFSVFCSNVPWTWPMDESQNGYDLKTGLYKKHYRARDQLRVMSCAVSHARLWQRCVDLDEPIVVLEHDTIFTRTFDPAILDGWEWGAVGLNDPRGATRKAGKFHQKLQNSYNKQGPQIHRVPRVDDYNELALPMGLAGNSAYAIKPFAANELLHLAANNGLWPNDAMMCSQLFRWLRVITPYYTRVQPMQSTTTG